MTTKERLHQLVDDLSEVEAADVLRVVEARRDDAWWMQPPQTLELTDAQAARAAEILDQPELSEAGLRYLNDRADEHRRA